MNNKSKEKIPYTFFNTFVLRTPFYSFQEFQENLDRLNNENIHWREFLQDTCLQEAIFLGSPVLYDEIQKYLSRALTAEKDVSKLKMSVLRYYSRMSTRCTPFGLFAGFSMGQFGDDTDIELVGSSQYTRYTRLDMNYLCNLAQDISKLPDIKDQLKYFPNNSRYLLSKRLRYVEYYFRNAKRIHHITAVDHSEYLENILSKAQSGSSIQELAALLVDEDITLEEARDFICELIDNQILISELEPAITGKDFLIQIISVLQNIQGNDRLKELVPALKALLSEIDSNAIGATLPVYNNINEIVKELGTAYEEKFLFQTDMFKPAKRAVLSSSITQTVQEALELMNKISPPPQETYLSKFAKKYYERYENMELPLLQVLDTETGIGYQQSSVVSGPALDGYIFPAPQNEHKDIKWNRIQSILHKKVMGAYKDSAYRIEIEEKDFDFLTANWDDLPITFSSMCEIFSDQDDNLLIYVHNSGSSSAANLLGRFCHVNEVLEDYVNKITGYEQSFHPDRIYAEIIHLPESRLGNILLRPVLRDYEIPYLGKSSVDEEHQIPLSDLYISVRGNTVYLRSKRLNKQIVPRLSTAHNFSFNSMPVYHFLCDMQTQGLRGGIGFHWGSLFEENEFLPRVLYKNVILSLAKWTIQTEQFKKLFIDSAEKKDKTMENIQAWREEKQMPKYVMLPDSDNTLFVDLTNYLSVQMLYSTIKKRPFFQLEEFPFDPEHAVVKDEKGNAFTNEFIFGFYKVKNDE